MKRLLAAATFAGLSLAASAAHAGGNVYWSIGINAPLDPYGTTVGTTISNGPIYRPAPVYIAPVPVYVPAPVYVQPRPVYLQPQPVVVVPRPVYVPRVVGYSPPGYVAGPRYRHSRGHRDGYWTREGYRQYPYGPIAAGHRDGWRDD